MDINVLRNWPVLIVPNAGSPESPDRIQLTNLTGAVGMPDDYLYQGSVAGLWMFAPAGTDASLVQQARNIAAMQKSNYPNLGFDPVGADFHNDALLQQTMPWNWGVYYIPQVGGTRWFPLMASGSVEVPVAGQWAGAYGIGPNDPIMKLSAGYDVTDVSTVHAGGPQLFGWPVVTVTYRRNGSVPAPMGAAPEAAARESIPGFTDTLHALTAGDFHVTGSASDVWSGPQATGMGEVLVGAGAPVGVNMPISSQGLPVGGGVQTMLPTGEPIMTMLPTSQFPIYTASGGILPQMTGGGGGLQSLFGGGMMPLVLIGVVGYLLLKK